MFDEHTSSLFRDYPEFQGLTSEAATQALSNAYLAVIQLRVNGLDFAMDEMEQTLPLLRRIANTLMFHVVLNDSRAEDERQAGAFVAAEAIALMAEVTSGIGDFKENELPFVRTPERFARVESALLYLYAKYDACAAGVLGRFDYQTPAPESILDLTADYCFRKLEAFCRFQLYEGWESAMDNSFPWKENLLATDLEEDTLARLYVELGELVDDYVHWLTDPLGNLSLVLDTLDQIIAVLGGRMEEDSQVFGHEFARIYHLCILLRISFPSLGDRSLVHVVPPPLATDADQYALYLRDRAVGNAKMGSRPVLWPSAFEFVQEGVIADTKNVVISMPTGSGKSFIAELAVSQAISDGWALYLAPTNALTQQIRNDLSLGLKTLGTEVRTFIGDREYSIFSSDRVDEMPSNSVAVMTPEKCALALRLSPDTFNNCRLVVFDECHLIGETDSSRGPVAELVLTQLMLRTQKARFLLMSAIIQNPDELSEWVGSATKNGSKSLTIKWKPTRILRTMLGVKKDSFQKEAHSAKDRLAKLPDRRRNIKFQSDCVIAANLLGAWQSKSEGDYAVVPFDCKVNLSLTRKPTDEGDWHYSARADSWVNDSAIQISHSLSVGNVQTLVFIPANKHYPFSNGTKVNFPSSVMERLEPFPPIVEICRTLSEFELGCSSEVFELLDNGVAVHTSIMLETEKIGSEAAFRNQSVPLMFSTGTLAQGLNLPAIAVVIAGTRIGDPRDVDSQTIEKRKLSQLLNAAGRAGRAGFANQGIVIAVPDEPIILNNFDSVLNARESLSFLQQSDDSISVESGLRGFLDAVCQGVLTANQADNLELQIISLLGGGDQTQLEPHSVLERTYASFQRSKTGASPVTSQDANQVIRIGKQFISETGAPEWLTVAAQRAGLDFFLILGIQRAWSAAREDFLENLADLSVTDWATQLIRMIAYISPSALSQYLPKDSLSRLSPAFSQLDDALFLHGGLNPSTSQEWEQAWGTVQQPLLKWMEGGTLTEIASLLCQCPLGQVHSGRKQGNPLPKTLSVTGETFSTLSLIAGGFLSVAEQELEDSPPYSLACLPMCIKYGCDSPYSLAWYRFGIRLRRPSRLLAEKFPLPPNLITDEDMKSWVLSMRSGWLQNETDHGVDQEGFVDDAENIPAVLSAIRSFLIQ